MTTCAHIQKYFPRFLIRRRCESRWYDEIISRELRDHDGYATLVRVFLGKINVFPEPDTYLQIVPYDPVGNQHHSAGQRVEEAQQWLRLLSHFTEGDAHHDREDDQSENIGAWNHLHV